MNFSLADIVREHARRTPSAPALSFDGTTMSWAVLDSRSSQVARALASAKINPGERIAVIARNTPIFYELLFGCAKAGVVLVPVNWRLSAREIAAIFEDATPRLVIVGAEQKQLAQSASDVFNLDAEVDYPSWRDSARNEDPLADAHDSATLALLYTSGTTGRPKGVRLSHTNLSYSERMARESWGFTAASVNLVAMPLFHIGGLGYGLMAITQGGHTVILQQATAAPILEAIVRYRVTHAFFVPSVIQALVDEPNVGAFRLGCLERIVYGAAPISETLLKRAMQVFGCGFNHAYGMTETAGTVVTLQPQEHDPGGPHAARLLSCGRPVAWVELAIRDPATGETRSRGQIGEIWIRSQMVTDGYWNNPAETAAVITPDSWLRTGDAAVQDVDGFVYIRDRYKDLIVSGGENVFPAEVESVLAEHPDLHEFAVIGTPHPRWGETVKAVVVARAGRSPTAADVIAFCRTRIAHYKCPTVVEFVDALPKSASGKILRRVLRGAV